jgi:hypothetical protein
MDWLIGVRFLGVLEFGLAREGGSEGGSYIHWKIEELISNLPEFTVRTSGNIKIPGTLISARFETNYQVHSIQITNRGFS